MKKTDWFLAMILAAVVVTVAWIFAYPCPHPNVWTPLAEAAGLRPTGAMGPGLWRALMTELFAYAGIGKGLQLLPVVGCVLYALLALFSYHVGFQILMLMIPENGRHVRRRMAVRRIAALLAALAFLTSEPVWRGCQACEPDAFHLLLLVASFDFVLQFLSSQRAITFFFGAFLVGVTVTQTIWGVSLVLLAILLFCHVEQSVLCISISLNTRTRLNVLKWKMAFLWLVGVMASIAIGIWAYDRGGGFALNSDAPAFIVQSARSYVAEIKNAADVIGWVGAFVLVAFPCALLLRMLPEAANEDVFLTFRTGFCYLAGALAAASQLSILPVLWIWSWTDKPLISSDLLQMLVCALAALILLATFAVFGIYASCRSHVSQSMIVLDEVAGTDDYDDTVERAHLNRRALRWRYRIMLVVSFVFSILFLIAVAGDRRAERARAELSVVVNYLKNVIKDASGCKYLFTDGTFDDILRLVCAANKRDLYPFSFMDGRTPLELKLITDHVKGSENLFAAKMGAPTLLRTWAHNKAPELAESGVQIGFELWRQDLKAMPPCWGTMLRTAGDPAKHEESVKRAKEFAEQILSDEKARNCKFILDRAVNMVYQCVQWRLSRLMRARSDYLEGRGELDEAVAERKFAERLDNANIGVKKVLRAIREMEQSKMRMLAPREGLHLALVRADFPTARLYAEKIVASAPRNPEANYAMAMSCVVQRRFKEAERYFKVCLDLKPNEPVLLNNLAMCYLGDGRLAEARVTAEKAQKIAPDALAIRNTLRDIAEAEAIRQTNGVLPKVEVPNFGVTEEQVAPLKR